MKDTNKVTIIGRLANNITLTYSQSGTAIGRFALATTTTRKTPEGWKDQSNFFDVTVFGSIAKNLSEYLRKGKQVCVDGELHQDRWTDKEGKTYFNVYILALNVQLLGGNKNNAENIPQQAPQQIPQQNPAYKENPPMTKEQCIDQAEAAYNAQHQQDQKPDQVKMIENTFNKNPGNNQEMLIF